MPATILACGPISRGRRIWSYKKELKREGEARRSHRRRPAASSSGRARSRAAGRWSSASADFEEIEVLAGLEAGDEVHPLQT